MQTPEKINVLFICLGNICRSPTAHGIFEELVRQEQLNERIYVDSCGTGDWHIGHPPDARATSAARSRGIDLSTLRARQVCTDDFHQFDYLMAMDNQNLADLKVLRPAGFSGELDLLLRFTGVNDAAADVPDPYFGGEDGFHEVFDLIEKASLSLLAIIRQQHKI